MTSSKNTICLSAYFVFSLFSYFLVTQGLLIVASIFNVLSISMLGILYYLVEKKVSYLFFVFLASTALADLAVINGAKAVVELMSIASTFRFWATIFLIKKNTRKLNFEKKYYVPIVLTSMVTMYFVISILRVVFEQVPYSLTLPIICALSFVIMATYMVCVYFSSKNMKSLWLLLTLVCDSATFLVAPIEALIFPSIYLQAVLYVLVAASSFFVFKFLVTKEYKIEVKNKTMYL